MTKIHRLFLLNTTVSHLPLYVLFQERLKQRAKDIGFEYKYRPIWHDRGMMI